MKMKTFCCLVLSSAAMLGLCACGNQNNSGTSSATEQKNEKAEISYHTPDAIKNRGELTVGVTNSENCDYFKNKDGSVAGYCSDLADAIAKEIGAQVKVKFTENKGKALLEQIENGEVDICLAPMEATPTSKQRFTLSKSYWPWKVRPYSLYILGSNSEKYKNLSDLAVAKIGVIDKQLEAIGKQHVPTASFVLCDSNEKCSEKLKSGEIDAILTETTPESEKKSPFAEGIVKCSVTIPESEDDVGVFIAMMKDNTELQELVNKVIKTNKESGNIKKWIDKAFKEYMQSINLTESGESSETSATANTEDKQTETTAQN